MFIEEEFITEIEFTHNDQKITCIGIRTNLGQIFIMPDTYFDSNPSEFLSVTSFKSDTGIVGFKGRFDRDSGFISQIEVLENCTRNSNY